MRRLPGQAARLLRRLVAASFAIAIVAGIGLGVAAWRLSQGPLELPFVAERIEAMFNREDSPTRLEIGTAAIAWDGWRQGYSPFELRLSAVRAVEPGGRVRAELPDVTVSLSHSWLLIGRVAPRRIELTGLRLRVMRAPDGGLALDLGSLAEGAEGAPEDAATADPAEPFFQRILAALTETGGERSPLSALDRVSVRDARVQVLDEQLGATWSLERVGIEVVRHGAALDFDARATLALGGERAPARIQGTLRGQPARIEATLTLLEIRPAVLARHAPTLAPLAALDASASLEVRLGARADGGGASLAAVLHVGPGTVHLAEGGRVAIAGGDISAVATPQAVRLERAVLRFAPSHGAAARRSEGPILSMAGEAHRAEGRWRAALRGHLDWVPLPDLADHWPVGIAAGARQWLTANITGGTARNGRFALEANLPESFDRFDITAFTGTLEAEDLTVHWLRPMPPVEGVGGTVEFGLREIMVRVAGGRQQGSGIAVREGVLRFGGFAEGGPGEADLDLRLGGPVPDVLGVLRHPRLRLFERSRVAVPEMTGTLQEVRLRLGFPLLNELAIADIRMTAEGRVAELRVPRAVLGRDLERGTAEIGVSMDGLRVQGQAVVSEVPVRVGVEMDFRAGGADQVTSRETLSARADVRQLQAFGLDLRDWAEGTLGIEARHESRRAGGSRLSLRGDLRETRIALGALGWQKPRGTPGVLEAQLRLQGDAVLSMETLRLEAPDALFRARSGAFRQGWPERLEVQESIFGGTRFAGELRAPRSQGGEWTALLRGPVLDLRAAMGERGEAADPPRAAAAEAGGTPFLVDWRFDRAILGEGRSASDFTGRARLDAAGVLREAEVRVRFARAGAQARIAPEGTRRRLTVTSDDGGALLRLLDVTSAIEGGRLAVDGIFEHPRPGAPLMGQAELSDFVVHNAPAFAKLLQAMTLYGLVEAVSGPGLNFNRLIAPFRLTPEALELDNARAFSASLGLTARGRLERRAGSVDLEGTIVPAYFFNQILGNIPIFGRLFSPEAGGGVFAATYRMRGALADPQVVVNPLAALTPGFLRGIFGIGQEPQISPQLQRRSAPGLPQPPPARSVEQVPMRGPPPT